MNRPINPFLTLTINRLIPNRQLAIWLGLSVGFNAAVLLFRNLYLGGGWLDVESLLWSRKVAVSYWFLAWNLFLAAIPYGLSLLMRRGQKRWIQGILLFFWLMFLPNAPYIITDLLHLRPRPPIPLWYDAITIFSFAWTGLIFGYLSLIRVQQLFMERWRSPIRLLITGGIFLLTGIGIYIGRFLRWNSWDMITRPAALMSDLLSIITNPAAHWPELGAGIMLSVLLFLGFYMIRTIR